MTGAELSRVESSYESVVKNVFSTCSSCYTKSAANDESDDELQFVVQLGSN